MIVKFGFRKLKKPKFFLSMISISFPQDNVRKWWGHRGYYKKMENFWRLQEGCVRFDLKSINFKKNWDPQNEGGGAVGSTKPFWKKKPIMKIKEKVELTYSDVSFFSVLHSGSIELFGDDDVEWTYVEFTMATSTTLRLTRNAYTMKKPKCAIMIMM